MHYPMNWIRFAIHFERFTLACPSAALGGGPCTTVSDKEGVFGVIAAHPVPENETMPPIAKPSTFDATARQAFRGKPQSVAHSRSKEQTRKALLQLKTTLHLNRAERIVAARGLRARRRWLSGEPGSETCWFG